MSQHQKPGEMPPNAVNPEQQTAPPAPPALPAPSSPMSAMTGSSEIWPPVSSGPGAMPPPGAGQEPDQGPAAGTPRSNRKHLVFGAAGLGIGLVAGIGLGQIDISFSSNAITAAAETCNVMDTFGIDVGDNGQSISISGKGEESAGAEYADVSCLLAELEVPDSVETRIGTTRALDGRQSAEWDEFTASWGYHPDSGLNIVIEIAD